MRRSATLNPVKDERQRAHRTASLEAYHAYVKGRHYWGKRDLDGVRAAIGFFRQAIDFDPTHGLAYVGLAECFVALRLHGWSTAPDALATAKAAAMRERSSWRPITPRPATGTPITLRRSAGSMMQSAKPRRRRHSTR
jgi:hypothetical protein